MNSERTSNSSDVEGGTRVAVRGPATLAGAATLRQELLAAFERGPAVVLDLSEADEVDLGFLQILVAAIRYASQRQATMSLVDSPCRIVGQAVRRSGLDRPPDSCPCLGGCPLCTGEAHDEEDSHS